MICISSKSLCYCEHVANLYLCCYVGTLPRRRRLTEGGLLRRLSICKLKESTELAVCFFDQREELFSRLYNLCYSACSSCSSFGLSVCDRFRWQYTVKRIFFRGVVICTWCYFSAHFCANFSRKSVRKCVLYNSLK